MQRKTRAVQMVNPHPDPNVNFAREIKTICHLVMNVGKLSLNSATFLRNVHSWCRAECAGCVLDS